MSKIYEMWELLKMASEYGEYDKPIEKDQCLNQQIVM